MARQAAASPLGRLTTMLRSATDGAPGARGNPFANYGVLTLPVAPRQPARPKSAPSPNAFDAVEARSRIKEFLEGAFTPATLGELVEYLAKRFMRIELRIFDGKSVNYLVDKRTKTAVPAAIVDGRLSRPGLQKLFGHAPKAALTPEEKDGLNLRARIAGRFMALERNGTLFTDWDDMAFSLPSLFPNRDVTVQGDEVWVGTEYARSSADPARNLAIMAKARAEGKRLVLPSETPGAVAKGDLVPDMPILLRDGAVRTRFIDATMSYAALTKAFGISPHKHFRELAARTATRADRMAGPTKVVSIDRFRRRKAPEPVQAPVLAAEAVASARPRTKGVVREVVKHELADDGTELMVLIDPATGAERPFDPSMAVPGTYAKEDAFGLSTGSVDVTAGGGVVHRDSQGRTHNEWGPAVVPAVASGESPSFVLDGETLSRAEFRRRTRGAPPSPQPSARERARDHDRGGYDAAPSLRSF